MNFTKIDGRGQRKTQRGVCSHAHGKRAGLRIQVIAWQNVLLTGLRPVFGRSSARRPLPQPPQCHPGVAKESSIGSSARPPCPQVPRWHPGVTKGASIRSSARRPCPQMSQLHPRVAKRSSDRASARRPCPQVFLRHPVVAKGASGRSSARRPSSKASQGLVLCNEYRSGDFRVREG